MRQIQTPLQGAAEKSCRKSCGKNGNTSGQHPAARRKKPENDNQRMNTGERAAKSDEASSHPKICFYTAGSGDVPAGASGLQWIRIRTGTAAENPLYRKETRLGAGVQRTAAENLLYRTKGARERAVRSACGSWCAASGVQLTRRAPQSGILQAASGRHPGSLNDMDPDAATETSTEYSFRFPIQDRK